MQWVPTMTAPETARVLILTAVEVIDELIKLGKEIQNMDKEPKEMGLSDFEYAFYTAIANNESAMVVMQKDKLRELAVILFEKVREVEARLNKKKVEGETAFSFGKDG